eukprot:Protomagalhaensia_wolfi_Nauph_80__2829@NODE_2939_length_938_cov_30_991101_g518_i1_p1_GENE_NODE_2939_length_938_cov_30_991101_g518_i1NODE_2939_length_938_cov_30_991101_g518_i1_p1_ORF_typecomplete_len211_score36_13zfDNL/PF05180_12/6_1e12_NODE_2939_length_938_cov_30_991101_g518_i162694
MGPLGFHLTRRLPALAASPWLAKTAGSRSLRLMVSPQGLGRRVIQPVLIERELFLADRPTLVSQDNVDRVPWLSMRHPEFQHSKDNEAERDIRGVTQVSEKFLLASICHTCGKSMLHHIDKTAYHHGSVLVRCACCRSLHLMSDGRNLFQGVTSSAKLEEKLSQLSQLWWEPESLKKLSIQVSEEEKRPHNKTNEILSHAICKEEEGYNG